VGHNGLSTMGVILCSKPLSRNHTSDCAIIRLVIGDYFSIEVIIDCFALNLLKIINHNCAIAYVIIA